MNTYILKPFLAMSLILTAVACNNAVSEEPSADARAAVVGETSLTPEAVGAARALLQLSAGLGAGEKLDSNAKAVADFAQERLDEVYISPLGAKGRKYFFTGTKIEIDVPTGDVQLVVTESSKPEEGLGFVGAISTESRPASARKLGDSDVRFMQAILDVARGASVNPSEKSSAEFKEFVSRSVVLTAATKAETSFVLKGDVMEQGDIVVGTATMTIEQKWAKDVLTGDDVPFYVASTTVTRD